MWMVWWAADAARNYLNYHVPCSDGNPEAHECFVNDVVVNVSLACSQWVQRQVWSFAADRERSERKRGVRGKGRRR